MKFCHDDRGCMYANQLMGYENMRAKGRRGEKKKKKKVSDRNLSGSAQISKSHKVCVATPEPLSHVVNATKGLT